MKKKHFTIVLALIIAIILFSSVMFLGAEATHDCMDRDCRICCQIRFLQSMLKNAAALGGGLPTVSVIPFFMVFFLSGELTKTGAATLVTHKVKLSN